MGFPWIMAQRETTPTATAEKPGWRYDLAANPKYSCAHTPHQDILGIGCKKVSMNRVDAELKDALQLTSRNMQMTHTDSRSI